MPLRCLDAQGQSLHAFALADADWAALTAANRRNRDLRMPCCPSQVVLRRSKLGTRHFAHRPGTTGCTTAPESHEHLFLKQCAVDAARAHGWQARTEAAGDGWQADVLAERGGKRLAIEIQWSPQSDEETWRRQSRYAAAGIRALWLFRQRRFAQSPELPAAIVTGTLAGGFTALGRPVAEFLDAVFERRFRFGFAPGDLARATVHGAVVACWGADCPALTRIVTGFELTHLDSRCAFSLAELGAHPPLAATLLARLPPDPARGALHPRWRKDAAAAAAGPRNHCCRCARPIGDARLAASSGSRHVVVTLTVPISAAWRALIDTAAVRDLRWGVAPPPITR